MLNSWMPVVVCLSCLTGADVTRVDLPIDDGSVPRKADWPVTTGVPFPRGQLNDASQSRLLDDQGRDVPLQVKVAAHWDEKRTSIRWLTLDWIAQPGRSYHLEFGPQVRRAPFEPLLREKDLRVDTGPLTVQFSKDGPSAIASIHLDGKLVASGDSHGEVFTIDQDGQRASNAKDGGDRTITIESRGPIKTTVRVDGFYTGPDGRRLAAYRTRYHLFDRQSVIKVAHEFRIVGSTKGTRWRDIGYSLAFPEANGPRTIAVDASGEPGNQTVEIDPAKDFRSVSLYQETFRHLGNLECRAGLVETNGAGEKTHRKMEQAGEWMQVVGAESAITGSLRWMWQQFPAEWEATPKNLTLHLWSPRGGELDFSDAGIRSFFGPAGQKYLLDWKLPKGTESVITRYFFHAGKVQRERGEIDGLGISKHHEFTLHFARPDKKAEGREIGRLTAEQPLALATGKWNVSTDVFGPLAARPNKHPEEAIVDRLFDLGRYVQDSFGDYGWSLFGAGPHYSYQWDTEAKRHVADPRRYEFHTYQRDVQHWWSYFRSGERKFLDWALPSENHWSDIAVSHVPTTFQNEWRGGEKLPEAVKQHFPAGDWAIDSTVHYLRHHDRGEAWLRGQSQFWASYHRSLETTSLAYFLTGDERHRDVLEYWKAYWGDLAGKTSASKDIKPWHREQAWFTPTGPGEKTKTWAEMIRDYAPFNSGSRHQLTLFFNLATLYENTWDPKVGQAVREYADAFLEPEHPIGVWRCQDNHAPTQAEAPTMSHFWSPALIRYARATQDPRMPGVLKKYFDACWQADPYGEDVGIYSNVQIGYAYYHTRDPRHLRAARYELDQLMPNARPLDKPEDLNVRLYNPYSPVQCFTAVPRLLWALEQNTKLPPRATTRPQRSPLVLWKPRGQAIAATLWGFDERPTLLGPDGKPCNETKYEVKKHVTAQQPFDRILPGFAVYEVALAVPGSAPEGWYCLKPRVEVGLLSLDGGADVQISGYEPVALHPGFDLAWRVPASATEVVFESALAKHLRVVDAKGNEVAGKLAPNSFAIVCTPELRGQTLRLSTRDKNPIWVRLGNVEAPEAWMFPFEPGKSPNATQSASFVNGRLPTATIGGPIELGKFGGGYRVTANQPLRIVDHDVVDGKKVPRFDLKQGTIECWIRRLADDRLTTLPKAPFLTNGSVDLWSPWKLPLNEWAHLAVVWRPFQGQTMVHVYVNGLDQAYYRSAGWEGYGNRPFSLPSAKWIEGFVSKANPAGPFEIDELRISHVPRYADLKAPFGRDLTFNPVRFSPPTAPFVRDADTWLLMSFDP